MKSKAGFTVLAIIFMLPILANIASGGLLKPAPEPKPELPQGKCVEEKEYMRVNHMRLLLEAKKEFLSTRVRSQKHSIRNCFKCHTEKSKFCDRCHTFAGIKPRCASVDGGCHFTIPGILQ